MTCDGTKGKKIWLDFSSFVSLSIPSFPCLPQKQAALPSSSDLDRLHVLGGGGTSDDLDKLASNDGLSGSVEENLVLVDHLSGVLGGVLRVSVSTFTSTKQRNLEEGGYASLTSMAFRRAEISQAWPSARPQ